MESEGSGLASPPLLACGFKRLCETPPPFSKNENASSKFIRLLDVMVAAFVIRGAISRKFIFRVKFEVNLVRPVIPWDVPPIAPGYRFTHWFVSENVSITHRQPDRP